MAGVDNWLHRMSTLSVYRAKHGVAPHKPLLLLVLLDLAERGELESDTLHLTPELTFRFNTMWPIVAYRRTQPPDIRMPFHRLQRDGFWQPFMDNGQLSPDEKLTKYVVIDPYFLGATRLPDFCARARRLLIARWFLPAERNALYTLYGISIPSDDEIARDAQFETPDDAPHIGRDARFRLDVVPAYDYTCALTGYRVTAVDTGSIVDAAHIHAFKDSRNNDPRNGIALSKNAHWLFDNGLWSIDDDYCVVVASEHFVEVAPNQRPLKEFHGRSIRLPTDETLWPKQQHLAWHRKRIFRRA